MLIYICPQFLVCHRNIIDDKVIFRQFGIQDEKPVLIGTVLIAFKYNTQGEAGFSYIVIKLAGNITGKTSFSQISETCVTVISELASQIPFQAPGGFFVGGLIEKPLPFASPSIMTCNASIIVVLPDAFFPVRKLILSNSTSS